MPDDEFRNLTDNEDIQWCCAWCRSIMSNNIKWGQYEGEVRIREVIQSTYETIIGWKKNLFSLPRGKCGTDFIKKLTELINLFVHKTKWQRVAISLVHIFVPIMLQKPSSKSKPRDHAKYLVSRLERWNQGDITSLMNETNEIQRRMKKTSQQQEQTRHNYFVKLMIFGKIGEAAKKINNDDAIKGVHPLNDEIKEILQQKHPKSREVDPNIIVPQNNIVPEPVIYEEITSDLVQKTARHMRGSGGPTLADADLWKHFLCSKVFGKSSNDLCQAIADLAKILCVEEVHPDCLVEYVACRMVPLDKGETKDGNPGVRPIGVGEVLRRLVGKLLIGVIKDDITTAAGPTQTCTGVKAGIEAAIHTMRNVFEDTSTEAILLVDAENAFNNLNRDAALQNIKEICPPFYRYLHNTYQRPAKLIIPGEEKYEIILSEEGTTQGDVAAMPLYGIGIKPLTDKLANTVDTSTCKQVWYADDSSSAGKLIEMKKWWDELCTSGPKYGYYPLANKTILIVKPEFEEMARSVFGTSGVKITTSGERHMGAVIGSAMFKEEYVKKKVRKWVEDVEELATIAKDEPQAVLYSSFTKAI